MLRLLTKCKIIKSIVIGKCRDSGDLNAIANGLMQVMNQLLGISFIVSIFEGGNWRKIG
jgi:hypothetical protein